MKREELEKLNKNELIDLVMALIEKAATLEARVTELEGQVRQNSSNSSKPPSSDGLKKPNTNSSLRTKSGRKPGGQAGHKGVGHKITQVDETVDVVPLECPKCGANLEEETAEHAFTKYESDLPEARLITIRYDFYSVICPQCKTVITSDSPRLTSRFRYGNNIRAFSTAMNSYCMVSVDKTAKMLRSLTGQPISAGTIMPMIDECAKKCEADIGAIKTELKGSDIIHLDETGERVKGKTEWVHVVSNSNAALFTVSPKRGAEGIGKSGVLEEFSGIAVHDCWKSYFKYDKVTHALCNAHILRELKGIKETTGQAWCDRMTELLMEMKDVKSRYQEKDKKSLSRYYLTKFNTAYNEIIEKAKAANPRNEENRKQTKAFNLIERLDKYLVDIRRFATDFRVPFDNNQAERDIRPFKVKLKVSGGFRTADGADNFATVFSVVQTTIKRSANVFDKIKSLFALPEPVKS